MTSSIYIIGHLDGAKLTGPCKIGISSAPAGRLSSLQTGNPTRLGFVFIFAVPDQGIALALEAAFHKVMASHRLAGEWFDIMPLRAVDAMCRNITAHLKIHIGMEGEDLADALAATGVDEARRRIAENVTRVMH